MDRGNNLWGRQEMGGNQLNANQLLYNLKQNVQQQLQHQQLQQQFQQSQFTSNVKAALGSQSGLGLGDSSHSNQSSQKQKVVTGVVTKIHDTFGFVDEEIFFQMSAVKGKLPKLGDHVLVEASYNPSMPFKWNASRLQIVPVAQATSLAQTLGSNLVSGPVGNLLQAGMQSAGFTQPVINMAKIISTSQKSQQNQSMFSRTGPKSQGMKMQNMKPPGMKAQNNSGRFDRERDRGMDRMPKKRSPPHRSRSPKIPVKTRSPAIPKRSRSPPRRAKPPPRYVVQLPRYQLNVNAVGVLDVKARYSNMYIPSDFFHADLSWSNAFSLTEPFSLGNYCNFCIMPKELNRPYITTNVHEATDCSYKYSAKVMLMACPALSDIYRKACALAEDMSDVRDSHEHPSRFIEFLVGMKNKGEPIAIGGPWSPSLDGPDPESDPRVLINTAIRTTEALTGIDLSGCNKWYRFAEIRYIRSESVHKTRTIPAHVETVVIFLPDIWSVQPDILEWEMVQSTYKKLQDNPDAFPQIEVVKFEPVAEVPKETNVPEKMETDAEETKPSTESAVSKITEANLKSMKVAELREHLEARHLSPKGVRTQLVARLSKALKDKKEDVPEATEMTEEPKAEKVSENGEELAEATENKEGADKTTEKPKEVETPTETEKTNGIDSITPSEDSVTQSEDNVKPSGDSGTPTEKPVEEKDHDEVQEKKPKESADKDMKSKDKKLEKKPPYKKLPSKPAIIVHPSKTAKDGKFDCKSMSLSVLLDYRLDDTKEHVFEVSLFAEMFNDMLMRDHAFKIYDAISKLPEKVDEKKPGAETKKDSAKDGETGEKVSGEAEGKGEDKAGDKHKLDDKNDKGAAKKAKLDTSDHEDKGAMKTEVSEKGDSKADHKDDDKSKDLKEKDRKKSKGDTTLKPDLLLAFIYFDQNHTGYLEEKDLTEILHLSGIQLSRSQVKKLVQRAVIRDRLMYRKLTDFPKDTVLEPEIPSQPLLSNTPATNESCDKKQVSQLSDGVVDYKGSVINLDNVLTKLSQSDVVKEKMQSQVIALNKAVASLKDNLESVTKKRDSLGKDLDSVRAELALEKTFVKNSIEKDAVTRDFLIKSKVSLNSVIDIIDVLLPKKAIEAEPPKPNTKVKDTKNVTTGKRSENKPVGQPLKEVNASDSKAVPADDCKDPGNESKEECQKDANKVNDEISIEMKEKDENKEETEEKSKTTTQEESQE